MGGLRRRAGQGWGQAGSRGGVPCTETAGGLSVSGRSEQRRFAGGKKMDERDVEHEWCGVQRLQYLLFSSLAMSVDEVDPI